MIGALSERGRIGETVATASVVTGLSAAVAVSAAQDRLALAAAVALAPAGVYVSAIGAHYLSTCAWATRVLALVWFALIFSTFTWRDRTTEELVENPLDTAAITRVALVCFAAAIVAIAIASGRAIANVPWSLRFLGLYLTVGSLAALGSPLPLHAGYRVFELGVGLLTVLVAVTLLGRRAASILLRLIAVSLGTLIAVVWIEALAAPSKGFAPSVSILPYELQGYMPSFSSNTVGLLAALLAAWAIAQSPPERWLRFAARGVAAGSIVTLIASQYRTGIIGFALAAVIILLRRHRVMALAAAAVVALVMSVGDASGVLSRAEHIFAKGRPETVATLDSRTLYWKAARPAIEERPWIGWGLNVKSRQVLTSILGSGNISTIHGTWPEALLGTGVIGTAFLGLALLFALRDAWRARFNPLGLAALAMLTVIAVRSLTGSTIELFDIAFLCFVALAAAAGQACAATLEPEPGGPATHAG